jgi:hypothetical protein
MGSSTASDIALSNLTLEQKLFQHLTYNHYPPVHPDFIPSAIEAIEAYNEGDYGRFIFLPNGKMLTADRVIEGLHLEYFLDCDDTCDE